ncbi:hypothetical protein Sru01_18150 [Sphaerisporangium rufum]|uniref:Cell division protein FtsL n=1 Tax=Sphaerisporangium rufum TaxID=1381558 RepID=A0A919QZY4_9ACTN|nr:hypothetical protein [Sphaerisporangium rufum]GII76833.1 hypothetical protein Sru01_18150 [Sphaerisporangium rufum]
MRNDKETTRDTGRTATLLQERPVREAAAPRAPVRPARRPAPARRPRRVAVPGARPERASRTRPAGRRPAATRTPFVLLVVGLMCGGLVTLLLLNLMLAQDSFRVKDLRDSTNELHQQAQDMRKKLLFESQPGRLDERARQQGLRPDDGEPRVLDLDGAGRAGAATGAPEAAAEGARQ